MAKSKEEGFDEYLDNYAKIADLYNEAIKKTLEKSEENETSSLHNSMPEVWGEVFAKVMENPEKLYENQIFI